MELDSNSDALLLETRTTEVFGKHPSFRFFLPPFLPSFFLSFVFNASLSVVRKREREREREKETGTVETTDALINACSTSRETITSLFPDQRGATPEKARRKREEESLSQEIKHRSCPLTN